MLTQFHVPGVRIAVIKDAKIDVPAALCSGATVEQRHRLRPGHYTAPPEYLAAVTLPVPPMTRRRFMKETCTMRGHLDYTSTTSARRRWSPVTPEWFLNADMEGFSENAWRLLGSRSAFIGAPR